MTAQKVLDAFLVVANILEAERQGIDVPEKLKAYAIDHYLFTLADFTTRSRTYPQLDTKEEKLG